MGWNPVVVINGLKMVRELLVTYREDTADRPEMPIFPHIGYGQKAKGKMLCGDTNGIRARYRGQ